MINSKTTSRSSSRHLTWRVRPSSTPAWTNPSTCRRRTTRAPAATASTQGFPATEVDQVITTMNLRRTRRASSSSRCRAARPPRPLPAIRNRAPASGTFHLTTRITPTSIPLTTTRPSRTRITATITSRASWVRWTWTSSSWTTTACCRTTTTTAAWTGRCVGRCCQPGSAPTASHASPAPGRSSCGNSYSNSSPTSRARASSRGPAMAGSLSWLTPMRWDIWRRRNSNHSW